MLLRNNQFKQLYRELKFRRQLVAVLVDEGHIIHAWASEFRKDYNELKTLRLITGGDVPWAAVSATLPTHIFKTVYDALGMGAGKPFWGIDLGADRQNLVHWVRPMEYS
ncbi:hypothetical protein OF83DRAFT_1069284, partial [Amylostereum chailletii]